MLLSKIKDCYASLWGGRAVSYRESQGYNHECVVSGKVTPDTYICTKDGIIKKTIIGSKSIEVVYSEKGMIKKQEVDEIRQKKTCLSSSEVRVFVRLEWISKGIIKCLWI